MIEVHIKIHTMKTNEKVQKVVWLTFNDAPYLEAFCQDYINNVNKFIKGVLEEDKLTLKFGYLPRDNGRQYQLKMLYSERLIFLSAWGYTNQDDKGPEPAFKQLSNGFFREFLMYGIVHQMRKKKIGLSSYNWE